MKATMMDCVMKRVLFVSILTLCLLGTGLAKHVVQHFPRENNGNISASTDSSVQTQLSKDDRQLPPLIFPGDDIDSSSTEVLPTSSALSKEDKNLPPLVFPGGSSSEGHLPPEVFPKTPDLPPSVSSREGISSVASKSEEKVLTAERNESKQISGKNTDNTTTGANKETLTNKYASEVPDLLNADKYNRTVYEDGTEPPVEKDTVTVQGPNVVNLNKTHEEDITTSTVEKNSNETKIETVTENKQNVVTSTLPPLNNETATEDHQNVNRTLAEHTENNVTSAKDTTKNGTGEEVVPKDEESTSSTTPKTDVPIPDIQSNKTMKNPKVKNDTLPEGSKEKKKSDNKTVKDDVTSESSTSANKESTEVPTPSKPVTEASSAVVQTTLKAESTTSVDISENLIDHKAEAMIGSQDHADHQHASMGKTSAFLQPTESAAILAGVFVGIALIGYVGLLIWRRVLEKRYGNREMLVNEDDFYDTNDLRNFEL
ncbi:uncharacterized protein [Periplaneta americana]|uniref:uncharacterized protein isoform X1 n=1 Tax=Periplaneta americana TaxID=6978 RepID=UPI0037E8A846